jgi:serine/threonine protein kinase
VRQTSPTPEDPLVGQTLGERYVVEAKLGHGATGTVYRARHAKLGRPFAVKVLRRELVEDPKVLTRFTREAQLAGTMSHRNLVGVVDVGEVASGQMYMVMELAEGPDLGEVLGAQAPLPPARVCSIVKQLCDGLDHAHDRGMIHRDFKPENVIVVEGASAGADVVVKIVDFGIAILKDQTEDGAPAGRLTTAGIVVGTPSYMAPEQALARPVDHRVDLYALGVIIYEMLCGLRPFKGTGVEIAHAHVMADPPPVSVRVPFLQVDPLLEALAMALMAKKPDQRPQTARAVKQLVELIETDRAAAAAQLGVTEALAPDEFATTQLPVEAIKAGLVAAGARVSGLAPTVSVESLAYDELVEETRPPRRTPWLALALLAAALALVGFALVYALSR